jgi:hypothetical protein
LRCFEYASSVSRLEGEIAFMIASPCGCHSMP